MQTKDFIYPTTTEALNAMLLFFEENEHYVMQSHFPIKGGIRVCYYVVQ